MIGYYNYTTWLTYGSLISAGLGIMRSLAGDGHPYIGIFFLMICGLFDAFDGRVARTKKNRTKMEQNFGIQIDSLADIVAFGVLPGAIANAMMRVRPSLTKGYSYAGYAVILFYMLMALIRLAYFNVCEEERQEQEGGVRKTYEGLPVTSSALIFPTVMLAHYVIPRDLTLLYLVVMLFTGIAFVSKIKVPKPKLRDICIMIGIGCLEFAVLVFTFLIRSRV